MEASSQWTPSLSVRSEDRYAVHAKNGGGPKLSKNDSNGNASENTETETSVRDEKLRRSMAKSLSSRVRKFGAFQRRNGINSPLNHEWKGNSSESPAVQELGGAQCRALSKHRRFGGQLASRR